jgi:rhodanese-related sulfurtransferase
MDINQLTEFAGNHTLLVLALVAIVVMLIGGEIQSRLSGIKSVAPGEATRMINHDNAIMIDMREEKDYREGHIVNAIHAPAGSGDVSGKLEKYRDKPVIVYCQRGQRSTAYCSKLKKQGFGSVYNLKGGLLAWQKEALPLSKSA